MPNYEKYKTAGAMYNAQAKLLISDPVVRRILRTTMAELRLKAKKTYGLHTDESFHASKQAMMHLASLLKEDGSFAYTKFTGGQ